MSKLCLKVIKKNQKGLPIPLLASKRGIVRIKNGIFSAVFAVSGNNFDAAKKQAYPSNRPKAKYVNVSFFSLQSK